jgi:anti-sigma regulatory factor (Ser/Thr protein kinase)
MPPITADLHELTRAMPAGAQVVLAALCPQVKAARTWAGMALAAWGIAPPARKDAVLILGELASNAVVHAGGHTFRAWLYTDCQTRLVIVVSDGSRQMPAPPPADPLAESGRGLRIVDALSEHWGACPTATGKAVWSVLPLGP